MLQDTTTAKLITLNMIEMHEFVKSERSRYGMKLQQKFVHAIQQQLQLKQLSHVIHSGR